MYLKQRVELVSLKQKAELVGLKQRNELVSLQRNSKLARVLDERKALINTGGVKRP